MSTHILKKSADLSTLHLAYNKVPQTEAQLGVALVEAEVISADQLRAALHEKNKNNHSIIHVLEKNGALDPGCKDIVLSSRLGIPLVNIQEMVIDPAVLTLIPADIILRYRALPLGLVNKHLVIALSDPSSIEAIQALNFVSNYPVEVVIAPLTQINGQIARNLLSAEEDAIISQINEDVEHVRTTDLSEKDLEEKASQRPIVRFVDSMLHRAVTLGASDINIRPGENGADIYFRIDGKLLLQRHLTHQMRLPITARIKIMSGMNIAERRLPQDGHTMILENTKRIDFRVSVIPMVTGESVVIRVLDTTKGLVDLDALGLPEAEIARMRKILRHTFGIFLVTGPTGSGKSTTLYAVLQERKKNGPHIITVEDPVEYRIDDIEQIQIKPAIGYSFAEALRHILRHDPDEILIGEMRDYETAEIAIKASLTGHFVMSTLHTNDAPSSITRLIDMGIEPYLINSTLVGVLAQRLVRRLCEYCKEPDPDTENLKAFFQLPADFVSFRGKGCTECHHTGYKGRMMVGELIEITPEIRPLIAEQARADLIRRQAIADGMTPLAQNALSLVKEGKTTLSEAFSVRLD